VDHVESILKNLRAGGRNALVLGGGLVGFKAAYALMRRGLKTVMVIRSGYPLSMQVDPLAGKMILDELIANGLEVKLGVEVTGFEGNGGVREARLSDGTSTPCDLAVIGKGVVPALDFIPRDRIKTDLGIVTDEHMETSAPGVFAAGDAAQAMDVVRGRTWVNAIQPVAVEHGRLAGANMAGRNVRYQGSIGRNVMRVFGLDVMTGGLVNPAPEDGCAVLTRFDGRRKLYRSLTLRGDVPVGMVMIGAVEQGGVILSLIGRGRSLSINPESLLAPDFNFGALMP
jgi:nitrite reductase (NADH) large subunit